MKMKVQRLAFGVSALAVGAAPVSAQQQATPAAAFAQHRVALLAQCPAAPTPATTDLSTHSIHVDRWGSAGPSVLLIHGGVQGNVGGGPDTFDGQQALARDGWQVLRADRPGFGASPTRGVDDQEADAHWIAAMLGTRSNLIGHSFGGAEALLAAAQRPDAVASLVLVEPALGALLAGDPVANGPVVRADIAKRTAALSEARTPAELGRNFVGTLGTQLPSADKAAVSDPNTASSVGCALLRARMATPDVLREAADKVARAGIPVLIVTGGWSPSADAAADAIARILHGRHVIVRSPNHFVQQMNPMEFNAVVNTFMRSAAKNRDKVAG